jgi:alpha-N-arabinofuranosidase
MKNRKFLKNVCFLSLAAIFCLLGDSRLSAQNASARIKIDIERETGEINPMLYGNFIEHLGRCIYGGVYEPGSSLSDGKGFRKDVMDYVRELNIPVVRWPGGNFVSGYHWEDGIGDRAQRPVRIDLAWGARESNSIGTDEYIEWCRMVNTQPFICVNLGTGTLDEARNWVEYCNVKDGTYYSDLRVKNGYSEPHKVTYWGLGNEIDGDWQMGHKTAEDYAKFALEAAKMMKWIDPDIKLIASGSSNYDGSADWTHWNRTVLTHLKNHIDYISLHHYAGMRNNNYYEFMASTDFTERLIQVTEGIIRETMTKTNRKTPVYIAFDEYNVWYKAYASQGYEEKYTLEDALVVAGYLNVFVRNAHIVKMANMAQLVNILAPIITSPEGSWRQTIFYPLALFANNCFGQSLQTVVDSPTYPLNERDVPYLDVSSAYNKEKNEIILNVVNRHKDNAIATDIFCQSGIFSGAATVYEVNGKDVKDENSANRQLVKTEKKELKVKGDKIRYSFPAHSYTMLTIPVSTK